MYKRQPLAYVVRNSGVLITQYGITGAFVGSPYGAGAGVDVVNGSPVSYTHLDVYKRQVQ